MRTDDHSIADIADPTHEHDDEEYPEPPEWDEPDNVPELPDRLPSSGWLPEPPHPVNWNVLSPKEAETEWYALDRWVDWLRTTYGLPPSVVPPYWHRHPELVWELSALHLHWLGAYDPEQHGSAPFGWHRDFADARHRLREWVALAGTTLTSDRPTRRAVWPGERDEEDVSTLGDIVAHDRAEDFAEFVREDVARRQAAEQRLSDLGRRVSSR